MIKYLYISVIFLSLFSYASESEKSGDYLPEWYKHHLLLAKNRKNRKNSKQLNSISRADEKAINNEVIIAETEFVNNPTRKKSINS